MSTLPKPEDNLLGYSESMILLVGTEVDGDYHYNCQARELLDKFGIPYLEEKLTDQRGCQSPWLRVPSVEQTLYGVTQIRAYFNQRCWEKAQLLFSELEAGSGGWLDWMGKPNRLLGGVSPFQKNNEGKADEVLGLLVAVAEGVYF